MTPPPEIVSDLEPGTKPEPLMVTAKATAPRPTLLGDTPVTVSGALPTEKPWVTCGAAR